MAQLSEVQYAVHEKAFHAAEQGDLDALQEAVNSGFNVHSKQNYGLHRTALHLAAIMGHLHVVEYLIESGTLLEATDSFGCTPLHLASEMGHPDVVKFLTEKGALVDARDLNRRSPLHRASKNGRLDVVKGLIEEGALVDARDRENRSPLHLASEEGHLGLAMCLIDNGAHADARDLKRRSPLHLASEKGHLDVVKYLLKEAAFVDATDSDDRSPLHVASEEGHLGVVKYLIEEGASVDPRNHDDRSPLHLASKKGHLGVVAFLIEKGASVDARDYEDRSPLHLASKEGHLHIVKCLIEKGALVDARDRENSSPLHLASEDGHLGVAMCLIKEGAPADARDKFDRSPLDLAAKAEHLDVVEYLVDRLTNLGGRGNEFHISLHFAAAHERLDMVKYLITIRNGALVNARNQDDCTPLHLAANEEISKVLVDNGADIEAADLNLWRPLHHAVFDDKEKIIKYLLEKGANATSQDIDGNTPCHVAADYQRLDLLKILLPHMKENLCNGKNQTVKDLIEQHYLDAKDSQKFSDLLKEFRVLEAPKVPLDKLPESQRLQTDDLFRYRTKDRNLSSESSVTAQKASRILKELEQRDVEEKEEFLKSLLEEYAHPRIYWTTDGHLGHDLAIRVQNFLRYFLGKAAEIDGRFVGTLEFVGSCADGTKLGKPIEFDFLLALQGLGDVEWDFQVPKVPTEDLSNVKWRRSGMVREVLEQDPRDTIKRVQLRLTENDIQNRWTKFLKADKKLDADNMFHYFCNLFWETSRRLESLIKFDFSFRKVVRLNSLIMQDYVYSDHVVPLVRRMKTGCTLRLHCHITGLWIDVDVGLGIKLQGWPGQRVIPFDELRRVVPPSVKDEEIGYCIVAIHSTGWQLSFVTIETMILSHCEERLLNGLKAVKILNVLAEPNEGGRHMSFDWPRNCNYLLKTEFLRYLASREQNPTDRLLLREIVVEILKNICCAGTAGPAYSFFLRGVRMGASKMSRRFWRLIEILERFPKSGNLEQA